MTKNYLNALNLRINAFVSLEIIRTHIYAAFTYVNNIHKRRIMALVVALSLAKSLADNFRQSQAKIKVVCSQHTKKTTADPFHYLHMGPMSDVIMFYEGSLWLILNMSSSWDLRIPLAT